MCSHNVLTGLSRFLCSPVLMFRHAFTHASWKDADRTAAVGQIIKEVKASHVNVHQTCTCPHLSLDKKQSMVAKSVEWVQAGHLRGGHRFTHQLQCEATWACTTWHTWEHHIYCMLAFNAENRTMPEQGMHLVCWKRQIQTSRNL